MPAVTPTYLVFQSTLPHGSDYRVCFCKKMHLNFNPRSLTGATALSTSKLRVCTFQSTFPHGSDAASEMSADGKIISIHAPSRERHMDNSLTSNVIAFQSTLPHGSDYCTCVQHRRYQTISIHAPSRERPASFSIFSADS